MAKRKHVALIPPERIEHAILLLRGQKVMIDTDLAALYVVETGQLVRAVKRNIDRFPHDFAFGAYAERVYGLETPNWHLKFLGWPALATLGIYGAGRCNALQRAAQQKGGPG